MVTGSFNCGENQLNSLKGCPEIIGDDFYCINTALDTLEYLPKIIRGECRILKNFVKELSYKDIKDMECSDIMEMDIYPIPPYLLNHTIKYDDYKKTQSISIHLENLKAILKIVLFEENLHSILKHNEKPKNKINKI